MAPPKQQRLRENAANSQTTIEHYLANPLDRAARLRALRDAKKLVTELQDGDDAFFDCIAHVSHCVETDDPLSMSLGILTNGCVSRLLQRRLCASSWPLAPLRRSQGREASRRRDWPPR